MWIVQVNSEWDLGIPMLYVDYDTACAAVRKALPEVGLEESLEDLMDENLISFEDALVVED